MEHWIARHIMKQLLTRSPAKWSELRPDGETDNLFGYYMKRLVAAGLIENRDKQWHLTEKGRVVLSDVSLDTMRETKTPKLCVMFAARSEGKLAVYRWKRAPYSGKVTLPYGRWHRGNTYAEAAQAELIEKAGVELPLAQFVGEKAYSVDKAIIHEVHTVCHVTLPGADDFATPKGSWSWVDTLDDLPWASDDHRKLAEVLLIKDGC